MSAIVASSFGDTGSGVQEPGATAIGVANPLAGQDDAHVLHPANGRTACHALPTRLLPLGVAGPADTRPLCILPTAGVALGRPRLTQLARHLAESEHLSFPPSSKSLVASSAAQTFQIGPDWPSRLSRMRPRSGI